MVDVLEKKKAELQKLPLSRAVFLKGVKRAQYQSIIWKSSPVFNHDKSMPDNYGKKRDCEKYIPVMTTLPLAPETPLQLIQCSCSKSVCENLGVSAKLTIYIVLICVAVEQKRTHVKILPVTNMLMTFEQLFSCGFRHFFSRINKNGLLSEFGL